MASQPEIADLVKQITSDVTTIVKGELELVKAELVPQAKSVGLGAGMFGAAGYFGVSAAGLLFISLSIGFAEGFVSWFHLGQFAALALGFLVVAVLLLLGAGVLVLVGKSKVTVPGPKATIEQGQASVNAVQGALERGLHSAETEVRQRQDARKDAPLFR